MSLVSSVAAFWFVALLGLPLLVKKNIEKLSPFFLLAVIPIVFFVEIPINIFVVYITTLIWLTERKSMSWLFVPLLFVPYGIPLVVAAIAYRSRRISLQVYTTVAVVFLLVSWQLASFILVLLFSFNRLLGRFANVQSLSANL